MKETIKEWQIAKENLEKSKELAKAISVSDKMASILINRGVDTPEKSEFFLSGKIPDLDNPFLFSDMQKAVDRIKRAIDSGESILIYGDRDVDGVSAVSIIVNTIKFLGGNVRWYVSHVENFENGERSKEGFGIHKDVLSKYAAENVTLLITVDCGVSAEEEIAFAKNLGMDVIITDHHEPHIEGLPPADAIINPKMAGSRYPSKNIAGCSVTLKTAQALMLAFAKDYNKEYMVCFAVEEDEDFCGTFVCLRNDLEIEKNKFKSAAQIKQIVNRTFRIYTNNNGLKNFLTNTNILLKLKIIVLDNPAKNIDELIKNYKYDKFEKDAKMRDFFKHNLDLCSLGTISDSMPLLDENRIIVREGLKIINSNSCDKTGLSILLNAVLKTPQNITARTISWRITPVLNSPGRMGRGMLSAQLLMTQDDFQAKALYSDILKLNESRKSLQNINMERFKQLLKEQCDVENDKALMIKASGLEHGVTGIVASHMVKEYSKPIFLIISDGNTATGTARSIEGFDIIPAFESVKDILMKYGGHNQAAGFALKHSKIDEFSKRILDYVNKNIKESVSANNIISIETELKISDINVDFYKEIEKLEPFGRENNVPIFCMKGVTPTQITPFGAKNEHLKFKVSQKGSRNVTVVFWNKAYLAKIIGMEKYIDIAFLLELAGKDENKIVQLHLLDIKIQ
jgi:single-stranded-DNA-specific exonuclease